jgi:type I restriction enzyme S subunit
MIYENKVYDSYKDSGIKWLRKIPGHWQVKRVKDYSETKSGTTLHTNNELYYEGGQDNWVRTTDLNNGELFETEYKITDLAIKECRLNFIPKYGYYANSGG